MKRIVACDAALEILDDIGFRGNPSKADLTSKDQVFQEAMCFQILTFMNNPFFVYRLEWEQIGTGVEHRTPFPTRLPSGVWRISH